MKTRISTLPVLSAAALALSIAAFAPAAPAQDEPPEFSELRVLIEINATAGDAGFQVLADGEAWRRMAITAPDGGKIYEVRGYGSVRRQGLTENFFESAEPPCSEQPLAEFLERFPAGEYTFTGKTNGNENLRGEAVLTHDLPGAPENLAPSGDGVDGTQPVVITWTAGLGLGNCPAGDADIGDPETLAYQVVVERVDPEPELVLSVDLEPDGGSAVQSVTLPAEFVRPGAIYKYEVVAIEARVGEDQEVSRGNQTISEDFFCTFTATGEDPCELPE